MLNTITNLIVDMNRGWPCKEQLNLSMPMLDCVTAKEIFDIDKIYIGRTMSSTIMYDIITEFMFLVGIICLNRGRSTGLYALYVHPLVMKNIF